MPSSYVDSFAPIVKLLIDLQPRRVVDIGPGWGKYGLACREYLPDLESLTAIEVAPGRLPTQDAIYDHVYIGDAREFARSESFWSRFDLAMLVDVIEHMTHKEGHDLLYRLQVAGLQTIVATPKVFAEQHDPGNPFETHRSLWEWGHFQEHGITADVSTIDAVIYLIPPRQDPPWRDPSSRSRSASAPTATAPTGASSPNAPSTRWTAKPSGP